MSALVLAALSLAAVGPADKWLNTAGLLLDILGLVLLEVSGVLQKFFDTLMEQDAKGEKLSSVYVREVIANPDPRWRDIAEDWVLTDPRAGIYAIVAGCVVQIAGTWA